MWRFQFAHIYISPFQLLARACTLHEFSIVDLVELLSQTPFQLRCTFQFPQLASRFASFPLLTLLISKHSRASTDRRALHICPFLLPSRAACFLSRILVWRLARKKGSGTSDHRDSIQSLPNQQLPPKTSFSNHTLPLELKLKACGTWQHRGIT